MRAHPPRRPPLPPTRFAALGRRGALGVIAAVLLAMAVVLAMALQPPAPAPESAAPSAQLNDAATYAAIVARMQSGEGYYPAAHAELLANGYGTRSVFNWRTPLYPSLLRWLPTPEAAQGALGVLALVAGAAAVAWTLRRRGRASAIVLGVLLLLSLAAVLAPGTVFFSEIAAGVLILLSVAAYGLGWRPLGLAAGLAALFVRELAGVYVLVALGLALRERRWREAAAWLVGLVAYAGYLLWHAQMVWAQLGPADVAYPDGWLQFGGLGFVLATAQVDGALFALPLPATAILLPLATLGLVGDAPRRAGLAVLAYGVVFAVVGKPFDNYWGAVYTPLLAFGLAALPATLRDLIFALRRPGALPA